MIARYNRKSLQFGIPGLILQFVVSFTLSVISPEQTSLQRGSILVGTILLFIGLGYYAIAKGRRPSRCLLGLLSVFGFIILGQLEDKTLKRIDG